MRIRHQQGFTLIEIMLAVAILAILSAIAIPLYQGYILEARFGTALKDIRQMELLLDDLASENDLVALDADNQAARGVFTDAEGNLAFGNVAACPPASNTPPIPWCDPWGNNYRYRRADNSVQTYTLVSLGPDSTAGTGDDVSR